MDLGITTGIDLWVTLQLLGRVMDDYLTESPLSGGDVCLYSILHNHGPATPGELADWTGLQKSTLSSKLKALEQREHGVRQPHPEDARSSHISLTETGRVALHTALENLTAPLSALGNPIGGTEKPATVIRALEDRLRATRQTPPRPRPTIDSSETPLTADEQAELDRFREWLIARRSS